MRDDVCHRAERVARDVEDTDLQPPDLERLVLLKVLRLSRDPAAIARVAVDAIDTELRAHLLVAADVIVVVMRAEDGDDADVLTIVIGERREVATTVLGARSLVDRAEDGPGFGGVDDRRLLRLAADEQVGVVVREAGDRDDAHRVSIRAVQGGGRPGAEHPIPCVPAPLQSDDEHGRAGAHGRMRSLRRVRLPGSER